MLILALVPMRLVPGCSVFSIALSRGYNEASFKEDMRKLFTQLGVYKKPTVFLFTAAQVAEEGMVALHIINASINS